jgi:Spy/CpxP family protein refolding chaperone
MKSQISTLIVPALLAAAIPATVALAQTPTQNEARSGPARPSADALARLEDGRIAMMKATLKLNDAQQKLWAPVEAELRASFAARQQMRSERRQMVRQGAAAPLSLPERLDRVSQRMAQRAERMKAFAEAFKPFYASLSEEQKAVAGIVLRTAHGERGWRGYGRRWAMRAPEGQQ